MLLIIISTKNKSNLIGSEERHIMLYFIFYMLKYKTAFHEKGLVRERENFVLMKN